jgi:hypothetical protein
VTQALFLVPDGRSFARAAAMAEMLVAGDWRVELVAEAQPRPTLPDDVSYVALGAPPVAAQVPETASLGVWRAVPWHRFAPHHEHLLALALSRRPDVTVAFGIGALGAGIAAAHVGGGHVVVDVDRVAAEDRMLVPEHLGPFVNDVERWLVPYGNAVIAASHALADLMALRAVVGPPDVVETRDSERPLHIAPAAALTRSGARVAVLGPPASAARFIRALNQGDASSEQTADDVTVAVALPSERSDYWIPNSDVLQALAAGIPVVAPDTAGAAGLIGRFGAGTVADGDPDSLAAALERLVGEVLPLERAQSGARAASEWLTPERQRQALLSTCQNVLAERPRLGDPDALAAGCSRSQQLIRNHPHILGARPDLARYDRRELGRELWRRLAGTRRT